jgi:hypothetical protein
MRREQRNYIVNTKIMIGSPQGLVKRELPASCPDFYHTRRASHRSLGHALSRELVQALPRFE